MVWLWGLGKIYKACGVSSNGADTGHSFASAAQPENET